MTLTAGAVGLTLPAAPPEDDPVELARAELLGLGLPSGRRAFVRFAAPAWPPGLSYLGDAVAVAARSAGFAVGAPRACLVNWNAWLQPHADKTAPYPSLNGMVTFRRDAGGGLLFLHGAPAHPDDARYYPCADGDVLVFSGTQLHEVTPITFATPDAYRASIVFYLPEVPDGGGVPGPPPQRLGRVAGAPPPSGIG